MNTTLSPQPPSSEGLKESTFLIIEEQWKSLLWEIHQIKKVPFPNEEMDSIWDISADDVEMSGKICYMNPCIGLSLLLIKKLKTLHLPQDIFLGVEFLKYPDGNEGFHFFVKVNIAGKPYIIDYSHDNKVLLYSGEYRNKNPKYPVTSLKVVNVPAHIFSDQDSIFAIAEKIGMNTGELRGRLSKHVEKLKKDNTLEQRNKFNEETNQTLEIIDHRYFFENIQKRVAKAFQVDKQHFDVCSPILKKHIENNTKILLKLLNEDPSPNNTLQIIDCLLNPSPTYSAGFS